MFCRNCGSSLPDNAQFCGSCGAKVERANAHQQPQSGYQQPGYQQPVYRQPVEAPKVGFLDAVQLFFSHYADFSGRSRRSEYWWVCLFNMLVSTLLTVVAPDVTWLSGIWSLVILVPSLALCIRRLHDVGKSGWWYLFMFLPLVGQIILLVQFCKDSGPANQWGPNPKLH